MRKASIITFILLINIGCILAQAPKNVIIFIGDGMGVNQVQAALTKNNGKLNMTHRTPYSGFRSTNSHNRYTTDSAAGGTAIACGKKTNNGMIGMGPDSTAINSIMYLSHLKGLSTGVISTSSITDATPSSFVAHQPSRYMQEEIAADFLTSGITLFIGGGKKFFENRKDNRNISDELRSKNYDIFHSLDDATANVNKKKVGVLMSDDGMESIEKRDTNYLSSATEFAIEFLNKNKKGFMLMVEGSQIDWAAHDNNTERMVKETLDFDRAIGKALDFAEKDGKTLILILADHETGGATISGGDYSKGNVSVKFNTGGHTTSPIPLFAYGPKASLFSGYKENTENFYILKNILKIKD